VEAKASGVAESACFAALILRADGFSRIFYDPDLMSLRDFENRIHVRHATVEIDRDYCFGADASRKRVSSDRHQVLGSTSANTGVAPT
jgi:hypothetical protein